MSKPHGLIRRRRNVFKSLTPRALLLPASVGISLIGASNAGAQTIITTNRTSTYAISGSESSVTVASGITISTIVNAAIKAQASVPAGVEVINHGTLLTGPSGEVDTGVIELTNRGMVTNTGLINGTDGYGIILSGADSVVNNTGTIVGGNGGVSIVGGTVTNGSVTERGALIQGGGDNGIGSMAAGPVTVTNHGTILSYGADGIYLHGGGSVTNYGYIWSDHVAGVGMGANGTITNYGTIQADHNGAAVAFAAAGGTLKLGTGSSVIGSLIGGGNGVLVLEGSGSLGAPASGFATLTVQGTEWTLLGSVAATNTEVQTGMLRLNGGSQLTSAIQVDSGATVIGMGNAVVGSVTLQNGGTVLPGTESTLGNLTITGNYVQQAGGKLVINTTPSGASRLAATGTATLNGVLYVNSLAGDYARSTSYNILSAAGGISGTFSSVLESDPSLVPTLTYDTALNRVILTLANTAVWTTGDNNVTLNGNVSANQDGLTGNDILNVIGTSSVTANLANIDTFNIGDLANTVSQVSLDAGTQTVGSTHILSNGTLILNGGQFTTDSLDLAGGTLTGNVNTTLAAPVTLMADSQIGATDGHTLTLSGDISGVGNLSKTGAGMVILNGVNSYTGGTAVNAGTLEVGDADHQGARIQGLVQVASAGTLRGHGTVAGNVINEGIVWPGGSIGTLTIDGDYMQSSNGTLMVDISPDSASQLKVTGTAALGGKLSLLYGPGTYHAASYRLVDAGAITGKFSSIAGNTPAGFVQTVTTSAKTVDLGLAEPGTEQSTDPGTDPGTGEPGASDPGTGTSPGGVTTVAPTNASIFGAIGSSALRDGQRNIDILLNRLARPCAAAGEQDCAQPANQAWVRASSDNTHQHGNNDAPGNTDQRYGFLVGADHNVGPWTLGLAAGYSHADVKEGDATGKIDTLRLAAYGSRQLGAVNVAAMVGGAYDAISSRRSFGSLGTTRSNSNGQEAQAGLQASLPLTAGPTVLTPRVGLRYQYFHGDSFNERGLDSQSLSVKGQDLHSLQPYVGVTADYGFNGPGAKPARLQGRIGYAYETLSTSRSVAVTAGDGTGFSVPGATPTRGMLTAGLSLNMQVAKQLDLAVSYDTLFRTGNTSAQTFRLGASYRF